jgi:hypothetical protein
MSAKSKNLKAPSWFEVGLGAVLSVVLGCAVGAALLVMHPVQKVKEIPKDAPAGAVYYIEGSRDFNRTEEVTEKRKALAGGESVEVSEGEINVFLGAISKPAAAAPKPGEKPPDTKALDVGGLNARIHDGKLQLADTVTVNLFGASGSFIVQATGGFENRGGGVEFVPESFYVGGCPVERLPVVRDILLKRLLLAQPVPDDLAAAWPKLASVSVEGPMLRLKMP